MTTALGKLDAAAALLMLMLLLSLAPFPTVLCGYQEHTRELHASLPMYTVTNQGGFDYVEIQGGGTLNEIGGPMVPTYSFTVLMLAGERVQSLGISDRSGFTNATGLILPVFEPNITAGGSIPSPGGSSGGWFPDLELSWETWVNPNGSSTLSVTLYPFRYNTNTTESSYCSQYAFEATYIVTSAGISGISSERSAYGPGETVALEVEMENPGEGEDFVVGVTILRSGSLEVVDALPLRTVHDLQGSSSLQMEWTGTDVEPGEYLALAEMNDTEGHWLSTASLPISIGMPKVEITAFSATPQHFEIGEEVSVEVTARNTGSVEVSGSCMLQIRQGGELVQGTQINYTGLKPNQQRTFRASWDTSNATEDEIYTALAYVIYEELATSAESCILSTNQMPAPVISYAPTAPWSGLNVTFDASASHDPDGSIAAFMWDFGDLAGSNGTTATHAYLASGNYTVTLTAVDDKGAPSQAHAIIQVSRGYHLNVTSNAGVAVEGSGLYPEGAVVQVSAPSEVPVPGIMGALGSKLVFSRWTGASNSTASTMSVTIDYETTHYGLVAVYQEQGSMLLIALLIVVVVAIIIIAYFVLRVHKKPKTQAG